MEATMRFLNASICSLVSVLGLTVPLSAATIFTTTLRGINEVPATASSAIGSSTVTLAGDILTVNETFSGLTAIATGAHIHCCSPVGVNAAIALPFPNFPSATSGTYNQSFDLTQSATYTAGFLAGFASTAAAETALINGLNTGLTYANIHDSTFPGGEIRGQLAAVPEPATTGLMLVGLISMVAVGRKRMYNI